MTPDNFALLLIFTVVALCVCILTYILEEWFHLGGK